MFEKEKKNGKQKCKLSYKPNFSKRNNRKQIIIKIKILLKNNRWLKKEVEEN